MTRLLSALAAVLLVAAGCTSADDDPAATARPTPPPRATAAPTPKNRVCHQLTYAQALAPTTTDDPVPCQGPHTSQTYAVGRLETETGGHLVAVDSPRVQRQVRTTCPERLASFLDGSAEQLRLSMLRAVWFTPTVQASDEGADWFRCDVIAVGGDQQLAALTGGLKGALGGSAAEDGPWAMCGTAEPGTPGFRRVPCGEDHSWRALRTIPLPTDAYPGEAAAKSAGQKTCREAGRAVAKDALDYKWGYEWPTQAQWDAGQTYGICWAPA
ncbi:Septum formation [Nocardioides terrae]|uniref:Septum formation n=1 Tax=Nocardioides terrae TaxID=574651 RepID=A0A1I1DAK3_9ACTN|nr:septum formation family protein [Nocardioides terrae]SFB70098.1 Septum formation [Nocardioides terrae]